MSVPDTVRHGSAEVIFEDYLTVGFNYRMTDIQAAIGRRQLERLPGLVSRRRLLASRYAELLGHLEELQLPLEPAWARSNWQSYCVRLPARLGQKTVMQNLLDQGISTRRGIMCSHREAPYAGAKRRDLLQSELAQDQCILLPIYAQMTDDAQEYVASALERELLGPRRGRQEAKGSSKSNLTLTTAETGETPMS
jgi:perosamine synthetase